MSLSKDDIKRLKHLRRHVRAELMAFYKFKKMPPEVTDELLEEIIKIVQHWDRTHSAEGYEPLHHHFSDY